MTYSLDKLTAFEIRVVNEADLSIVVVRQPELCSERLGEHRRSDRHDNPAYVERKGVCWG